MKNLSAREIAVKVLDRYKFAAGKDAGQILKGLLGDCEDKGVCRDISFGVVRNKIAIDNLLEKIAGIKIRQTDKRVVNILRVAVYELVYTTKPSEHAVLNEAVNIAHKYANKKSANFVNAILRNIQRAIIDAAAVSAENVRRDLPVNEKRFCRFKIDILPEKKNNPVEYLSKVFSIPEWLISSWLQEYGFEKTCGICLGSNRRPGVYVWVNTKLTDIDQLRKLFDENGIENLPVGAGNALKIKNSGPVERLPGFEKGLFTVQDLTAGRVVDNIQLEVGSVVIDLCAAPGGKTSKLAQRFGDAEVIATDASEKRLKKVTEMKQRLRLDNVKVIDDMEVEEVVRTKEQLAAVLVDVPCSNTGVMAKRVEVRHRLKPESLEQVKKLQWDILKRTAALNPKKIIYSTCSILGGENREMMERFCEKFTNYKLNADHLTLPCTGEFDFDGGYFAILENQS